MDPQRSNLLLNALSPAARAGILSAAEELTLQTRAVLQEQEETPQYAYFITSGLASVVVNLPEGGSQETALVGREGLTGAYSLLGTSAPPTTAFMQVPGSGLRIAIRQLRSIFLQSEEVRTRILQQVQQIAMTTTQIAACNNAHDAEARLARWLLMAQDRTQLDTFHLTQEFLSEMLGDRRTTVAIAAGALQRSGFIEYSRGRITIRSREDLQSAACDCYPVTKRLLDGLYR